MSQRRRYWELIKPLFDSVNVEEPAAFFASTRDVSRPRLLMFAAHFCLSEIHNGGLLQFFWNTTGILAPEAIEGFEAIGMPMLASTISAAASPLGDPYPRNRDDRLDALLAASGRTQVEIESIFRQTSNFYIAFEKVTNPLNLNTLSNRVFELANTENGDFGNAATKYAHSLNLFE